MLACGAMMWNFKDSTKPCWHCSFINFRINDHLFWSFNYKIPVFFNIPEKSGLIYYQKKRLTFILIYKLVKMFTMANVMMFIMFHYKVLIISQLCLLILTYISK